MDRNKQYKKNRKYIEEEGLDALIDFSGADKYQERVYDNVSGKLKSPFPPEPDDLVRLHKAIRRRKCFTVLEFGPGYSTLVIADALKKNQDDWERLSSPPAVRNRF